MIKKEITTLQQVKELNISEDRLFFSAKHDEIKNGAVTDVYFVRTYEILKQEGLLDCEVTAEIFPRRSGVFAGIEEVKNLLKGKNIKAWSIKEGQEINTKEVVLRISGPYGEFGLHETA